MAVQDLQDTIAEVVARVGPAVVGLGRGWGLGSGVVIGDGQVLTAAQHLRREDLTVVFADGGREAAAPGGVDPDLGLAVLSVVALANPGGRGLRATLGFVSAEARSFRGPRGRRVRGAIEHTAPLPRGSSGGPLVDPAGNLLGINSIRLDGGLILAAPANAAVKERVLLLARGEAPVSHRLGVAVAPPRAARELQKVLLASHRDKPEKRGGAVGERA